MRGYRVSFRRLFWFGLLVFMTFGQGCGCEDTLQRDDPMTIKILAPVGTLITEGVARARVEDFNGIRTVVVMVNGKKVVEKDAGEKKEFTVSAKFDLDPLPDTFKIVFKGTDVTGENKERTITVRKDQGVPLVRFKLPTKLDPKHNKIFVGKTFKTEAEARDTDGIAEISISLAIDSKNEQTVRKCAINKKADAWESCLADMNLSDAKYKDGTYILKAEALDSKGKKSERKVRLQFELDKTGPVIKIVSPNDGQRLKGGETFAATVTDQVGVKSVELWVGTKKLKVTVKGNQYSALIDKSVLGGSNAELKVVAIDNLDNPSEAKRSVRGGCSRDADCDPGMRCCLSKSVANKDGSKTGRCFKIQNQEGALCDPCTNPCGKGSDGQLMGCLPGACERPPHRCRRACNLGNRNLRPDKCLPANPAQGQPAEYCAQSDITRINSSLGSCAQGDNCNPIKQNTCQPGARPPYNNCCPAGFGCYPADDDANICIPEGSTQPGGERCELHNCQGGKNCTKGYLCTVRVNAQGQPVGNSKCNPMCQCNALCQAGLPTACPTGGFCSPVRLTNGNVPLPVGVCVTR